MWIDEKITPTNTSPPTAESVSITTEFTLNSHQKSLVSFFGTFFSRWPIRGVEQGDQRRITSAMFRELVTGSVAILLFFSGVETHADDLVQADDRSTQEDIQEAFGVGSSSSDANAPKLQILVEYHGRNLVLTQMRPAGGGEALSESCLLCTKAEALSRARSFGASLRAAADGRNVSTLILPELLIQARLELDGIPVVPRTKKYPIEPGTHQVVIEQGGTLANDVVEIGPGAEIPLLLPRVKPRVEKRKIRAAAIVIGLGLSSVVVGGTLLGLDGQCATAKEDSAGNCSVEHDLKGAGIGLIAGGAAIQALLIWLLMPEKENVQPLAEEGN
jgi:hypothetical protein